MEEDKINDKDLEKRERQSWKGGKEELAGTHFIYSRRIKGKITSGETPSRVLFHNVKKHWLFTPFYIHISNTQGNDGISMQLIDIIKMTNIFFSYYTLTS